MNPKERWKQLVQEKRELIRQKCGTCSSGAKTISGIVCRENAFISYDCRHNEFEYHDLREETAVC